MHTQHMINAHPQPPAFDVTALERCIDATYACAQACTSCADACLGEDTVSELVRCIRLNLDCADICDVAGRLLSRQAPVEQEVIRLQLTACSAACRACGEECQRHADHMEHCRVCAIACRDCEKACNTLLAGLAA